MDLSWVLVGGAALGTTAVTMWGYIRNIFAKITSILILEVEISDGYAAYSINSGIDELLKPSKLNKKYYICYGIFVKSMKRKCLVPGSRIGREPLIYWNGIFPIFVTRIPHNNNNKETNASSPIKISCIRGTFDIEAFYLKCVENYDSKIKGVGSSSRYKINHIFGSSGKTVFAEKISVSPISIDPPHEEIIQTKLLRYSLEDLGQNKIKDGLSSIYLPKDAQKLVDEIDLWTRSEKWHQDKDITWKRGTLIFGEPGTGKTALIRAIAEKYDLPIYSFDLSSLFNDELKQEWNKLLSNTPCIALFEDIDNVFNKRESNNENLSFDCFLNCLDGIERANGVLTFITTNYIEKIDEAILNRPGRIDRVVKMDSPDRDGKLKIANRILSDHPEYIEGVISEENETGAQFERKCIEKANELFWSKT